MFLSSTTGKMPVGPRGPSWTGVFDVRATKNRLTGAGAHRTLRPHSKPGDGGNRALSVYVQDLQYYRVSRHARQRHPSPWYGEEKRWRRAARDQERAARISPQPARAPHLGTRDQEVRPYSGNGAWAQDD